MGATLYYDGANLNAVMGIARPGDMGFDIVHFNLHKTFTQPHGGGGPGAGPIACSERIEPFLPVPQVVRRSGENGREPHFDLDFERPKSIGKLRGFQGNFGVFVRTYAYICSLGGDGLADVSRTAVLNANYLKALLAEEGIGEYLPVAFDRLCMHEFVLSGSGAKAELGVRTLDIAKRMLDHRVHPPTVYFPLLVDEALMIEPTETETKERLDHFAGVVREILAEAKRGPGDRPQRAAHHARPAPRRGRRGQAPGGALAPGRREPGRTCARTAGAGERHRRDVAGAGRRIGRCARQARARPRRRASARPSCGSRPATTRCRSRRSAIRSPRPGSTTS